MYKRITTIFLIFCLLVSCRTLDNKHFTDRKFARVLVNEEWYNIISTNSSLTFLDLTNIAIQENLKNRLVFFNIYKFNQDGTFEHQLIDRNKQFNYTAIDSVGAIKFSNTLWKVKEKKLYIKTDITMNRYNYTEKVMYQSISSVDNVYNIDIRVAKPINQMWITFVLIPELSKNYYKQNFKELKTQ